MTSAKQFMLMCKFSNSDRPNRMNVSLARDTVQLTWPAPTSFFTALTMVQCHNADDSHQSCLHHDVTDVTTLIVIRDDGEWLTLVLWQDLDDVLSYRISIAVESTKTSTSGSKWLARVIMLSRKCPMPFQTLAKMCHCSRFYTNFSVLSW